MAKKDPRIDAYITSAGAFARPILQHLRQLVHSTCPDVEETWKWSFPHFMYKGMFCSMAAFKEHCAFNLWHPSLRQAMSENKSGEGMGQLGKITSVGDLPKDAVLIRYLQQAMKLNEEGIKAPVKRAAPKAIKVPANVKAALSGDKSAGDQFRKLSPSQQREYLEWIASAKQEATADRRIATMLEWLAEGKSLNWKYEKKRS